MGRWGSNLGQDSMPNLAYIWVYCVWCRHQAPHGKSNEIRVHLNTLGFLNAANREKQFEVRKDMASEDPRILLVTQGQERREKSSLEAAWGIGDLPDGEGGKERNFQHILNQVLKQNYYWKAQNKKLKRTEKGGNTIPSTEGQVSPWVTTG